LIFPSTIRIWVGWGGVGVGGDGGGFGVGGDGGGFGVLAFEMRGFW